MSTSSVPAMRPDIALFLDFDGTLVRFEDDPTAVKVDDALRNAVLATAGLLDGALALISGRPIEQVDHCFASAQIAVAGLHGLERRDPTGAMHREPAPPALRFVAMQVRAALAGHSAVWLEDKGAALAIHFRGAPECEGSVRRIATTVLAHLGPNFRALEGAYVIELLPKLVNKGTAVRAFMAQAPFCGRRPIFIGDDVTDLDGFEAARELGGHGIAVGTRVSAEYRLADVTAVRDWLGVIA